MSDRESCVSVAAEHAQKLSTPIEAYVCVPGGKLLEALLVSMSSLLLVRATYAAGAEAVGGSGGCDQSWNSIHGIGAAGSQAAEAIGTEECGRLCASSDTQ